MGKKKIRIDQLETNQNYYLCEIKGSRRGRPKNLSLPEGWGRNKKEKEKKRSSRFSQLGNSIFVFLVVLCMYQERNADTLPLYISIAYMHPFFAEAVLVIEILGGGEAQITTGRSYVCSVKA